MRRELREVKRLNLHLKWSLLHLLHHLPPLEAIGVSDLASKPLPRYPRLAHCLEEGANRERERFQSKERGLWMKVQRSLKYLINSFPKNIERILNKHNNINIKIIMCTNADSSNNVKLSKKSYKT